MKRCSKCDSHKDVSEFGKNRAMNDGLAHWCKLCSRAGSKAAYRKNPEAARNAVKRWTAANKGRVAEKCKEWWQKNPEKDAIYKRERRASGRHNYAADSAKSARRRAQQSKATPVWSDPRKVASFYESADTLNMLIGEWHHVDHIVPLRSKLVCGLHNEFNLQILPAIENHRKSNLFWPDMP